MYGIERSAIAEQARQIVEDNKYTDRVTIIQGKVEEVELPVPQVPLPHAPSCKPHHMKLMLEICFFINGSCLHLSCPSDHRQACI